MIPLYTSLCICQPAHQMKIGPATIGNQKLFYHMDKLSLKRYLSFSTFDVPKAREDFFLHSLLLFQSPDINVLSTCMSVHSVYASQRPKEGHSVLWGWSSDDSEPPRGCCGSIPGSLENQSVFLTTKSSAQTQRKDFFKS